MTSLSNEETFNVPEQASINSELIQAFLEENGSSMRIPLTRRVDGHKPLSSDHHHVPRCLVIGRQAAAVDLHISHPSISRKHAALYFLKDDGSDQEYLHVVDGGGKYGTTVNGNKIPAGQSTKLLDSDRIVFGNVQDRAFTFRIEETTTSNQPSSLPSAPGVGSVKDDDECELQGRAKREAEIAAMVNSLDQEATYQKEILEETDSRTNDGVPDATAASSSTLDELAQRFKLPMHQVQIDSESSRRNLATCLAIDPAGSRFVVGSTDANLRFYDFGGMARNRMSSFQTVIPQEGQPLIGCAYSNTGDRILVGTGGVQPIVLDRDGNQIIQFIRGDMYVTDQAKTVGHTSAVTGVDWHPLERDWVLTSSQDGSARLWNIQGKTQFDLLTCEKVFQAKSSKGLRTAVSCVCFNPSGREFALGTACGSIQIWSHARVSNRPERVVYDAHGSGKAITSVVYNFDGSQLGSRSSDDDTVKVWDQRRLSRSSQPFVTCGGLKSIYEPANLAFSPDGAFLCCGESARAGNGTEQGRLHFYDIGVKHTECSVHSPTVSIDFTEGTSPVVVKWHSKLKQIFVGCSDGMVIILFDPRRSKNGAVLIASKQGSQTDSLSSILRARADASGGVSGTVLTPFSLPMYREDHTSEKKRKRQERKDPNKSKEPERPASGKHKVGGQEGSNVTFAQFVADRRVAKSKAIAGTDPRQALLRFGDADDDEEAGVGHTT